MMYRRVVDVHMAEVAEGRRADGVVAAMAMAMVVGNGGPRRRAAVGFAVHATYEICRRLPSRFMGNLPLP